MAIVKVEKFHLLVPETTKETLLRDLQVFRNVEFTDQPLDEEDIDAERLTKSFDEKKVADLDEYIDKCLYDIRLITRYFSQTSGLKAMKEGLVNLTFQELEKKVDRQKLDRIHDETKALGDELEHLKQNLSKTKEKVEQLLPFKNLGIREEDLQKLKRTRWLIGSVPVKAASEFEKGLAEQEHLHVEEISVRDDDKYYLLFFIGDIQEVEELLRVLNFSRVKVDLSKVPAEALKDLDEEKARIRQDISAIQKQIGKKADDLQFVQECYEYFRNVRMRYEEEERFLKTKKVNAIQGYIVEEQREEFMQTVDKATNGVFNITFEDVKLDEKDPPIMLKNGWLVKAFENVTETYALPKYNEVDPTPLFAAMYALFFGMMAADFGYGVILFFGTWIARKKLNLTPAMNLMMRFMQIIAVPVMIWGFLYGSYFGANIPGIWHLFNPSEDFMSIMIISVAIGIIQIFYSLGIKAYISVRNGQPKDVFYESISWGLALLGIVLLLGGKAAGLPESVVTFGKYAMIVGFAIIIIAGARASDGNIAAKLVGGLYNLYGISGYLGDIVSYTRLMALGLSGGFIAFAVNTIGNMLFASPIGIPFGILVLIIFHGFNLFLSFLGAYVHALRLVYVEFFGKFYEGGGRAFRVFRKPTKYINLDRQYEE